MLFPLGKSERKVEGNWSQAAQLTAEGLRFGLIIALAAVGLSLIFGTTGLTNFAHGELVTLGAIVTWWIRRETCRSCPTSAGSSSSRPPSIALVVCAGFGWLNDAWLVEAAAPARHRSDRRHDRVDRPGASSCATSTCTCSPATPVSSPTTRAQKGISLGPIDLALRDYLSMAVAVVVLLATIIALLRTRIGKATRAVSDNPALAAASGIDVDRVIRVVWVVGAMLAGLAGILLGLAQGIKFQMGFQILLLIFAAVTLGGLGTAYGALVGSLVVGMFVEVSTLWIPPELKNVGALVVLIVILLVRPQGILGRAQRVG